MKRLMTLALVLSLTACYVPVTKLNEEQKREIAMTGYLRSGLTDYPYNNGVRLSFMKAPVKVTTVGFRPKDWNSEAQTQITVLTGDGYFVTLSGPEFNSVKAGDIIKPGETGKGE